jgi:pilus assembly protein CpaE
MEQIRQITPLSVLVIARYDPTIDWVQASLQEQNYTLAGRVNSVENALQILDTVPVDVILADNSGEGVLTLEWIQKLAVKSGKTLILIIATPAEMDFVREAMLAGADGFLFKPFDLPELHRSITQLYRVWHQRQAILAEAMSDIDLPARAANKACSIAVFSPKGGAGATTLAVNLAVALKQETNAPVLLVDADLRCADVDIFLSIFSKHSLVDLVNLDQKIDADMLRRVASEHSAGITVLQGDPQLQFVDAPFESGQVGNLIEELISIWDGYVVINTSSGLERWTIEIIDVVDHVLVVTTPELPSLRVTRNFLNLAEAAHDTTGKWQVILNAYQGVKVMRTNDIEASIHYPIIATIAEDYELVPTSVNRGRPLTITHKKSAVAKDILALAHTFAEKRTHSAPPPAINKKPAGSNPQPPAKAKQSQRSTLWNSFTSVVGFKPSD